MAGRLRPAEWLAALGAVVLLVALFALHWYGPYATGRTGWWSYPPLSRRLFLPVHSSADGWQALPTLRWFVLATVLVGFAVALAQASVSGPAPAVIVDMLGMLLAGATTILLTIRLATTSAPLRFGAIVGLAAASAVTVGAFRAYRTEAGTDPHDPAHPIEVVDLGPSYTP